MSNYAILRIEKRGLGEARAMARHALRDGHTAHADPALQSENVLLVGSSVDGTMDDIRTRTEPLMKRRDAVRCVELFIGASPEAMAVKTVREQDAYFADALAWVGQRFGGADNIVLAVVHRDEPGAAPHMQILLTPIKDGRLNAKALVGNRADYVDMQTQFAAVAGVPHGLRRGERGSIATHQSAAVFHKAVAVAGGADALPKKRRIPILPPEPPEPGFFAGAPKKKEYAEALKTRSKAIAARAAAQEHNKTRERAIEALARVGVAVKGPQARSISQRLSAVEKREAEATAEAARLTELGATARALTAEARSAMAALPDDEARAEVGARVRAQVQVKPRGVPHVAVQHRSKMR